MPTVRNILNVQGSKAQAAALLDFISDQRYGRGSIDFNQVTPMPPWVYRLPTNLALLESTARETVPVAGAWKTGGHRKTPFTPKGPPRNTMAAPPSISIPRIGRCGNW